MRSALPGRRRRRHWRRAPHCKAQTRVVVHQSAAAQHAAAHDSAGVLRQLQTAVAALALSVQGLHACETVLAQPHLAQLAALGSHARAAAAAQALQTATGRWARWASDVMAML